jgi:uncharacterized protein
LKTGRDFVRISGITYVPRKTHRFRSTTVILVILLAVAMLSTAVISSFVGWNLTHPAKIATAPFSSNIVPDFKDISFKDITGKEKLRGWYFESKGSDKTVILAHGYEKNRLEFQLKTLDMIKELLNKGYNVFTFDFRGSGISSGNSSSFGLREKNDVLGAANYVKNAFKARHVTVIGFSTGAAASILAAANEEHGGKIDALVVDTCFSRLDKFLGDKLPSISKLPAIPFNSAILWSMRLLSGLDVKAVNPGEVISGIMPRPILFIHSRQDTFIPYKQGSELYSAYAKAAGDKTELWTTDAPGFTGSFEKYPSEYMQKVLSFLDKASTKN